MTRDTDLIRRGDAMDLRDELADVIGARPLSSIHSALSEYRKAIRALPAHPVQEPPSPGVTAGATGAENRPPFEFHRYINGQLMAEGVRIEKQATLEGAMVAAAKIASRGPNGEAPVLVLATRAPVVPAEGLDDLADALARGYCAPENSHKELDADLINAMLREVAALRSAPPVGARVTDDAAAFDRADWFWRTMDPDDCGDSPEEAISRAMVGQFCVCEIASSYHGPTRYGFIAPVLDPESDDEEFVHFATQQEAVEAAKAHHRRHR